MAHQTEKSVCVSLLREIPKKCFLHIISRVSSLFYFIFLLHLISEGILNTEVFVFSSLISRVFTDSMHHVGIIADIDFIKWGLYNDTTD